MTNSCCDSTEVKFGCKEKKFCSLRSGAAASGSGGSASRRMKVEILAVRNPRALWRTAQQRELGAVTGCSAQGGSSDGLFEFIVYPTLVSSERC